ncbi:MAG: hypothetical protein IIY16_07185 [Oscillospiraceae bacterium]|nr:hypothetical protein [Oscillospiraceae bacterium]
MKEKYADTIRKKVEAAQNPPSPKAREKFRFKLNRFNRLSWPLLISPLFTLLYMPVNRYVSLPLFGSGRAYTDMEGALVEQYFSANSVARILFWLLLAVTSYLLFHTSAAIPRTKRILFMIGCTVLNIIMGVFFLEFTLWE